MLAAIHPALRQLALQSCENAHAAILHQRRALFIAREIGSARVSANTAIGDTEDLHCTAVGKSLICQLSYQDLLSCFGSTNLPVYTPYTLSTLQALTQQLQEVRQNGLAVDDQEFELGVLCLASPVYNYRHQVVAAVGISGMRERVLPRLEEYKALILQQAGLIALGAL